jgi:hypothetical protein
MWSRTVTYDNAGVTSSFITVIASYANLNDGVEVL